MSENIENTPAPDAAEIWHAERSARIQSEREKLEAQDALVRQVYDGISERFNQLERDLEQAHDYTDTRRIVELERERADLFSKANELQNGYQGLQQQREALERTSKLEFNTLLENSSPPSQMMLRAYQCEA